MGCRLQYEGRTTIWACLAVTSHLDLDMFHATIWVWSFVRDVRYASFVKFECNWSFKIFAFLPLLLCRNPSLLVKNATPLASCRLLLMADHNL